MRESEEKYRELAENTEDILYSVEPDGVMRYIGPQIVRYGFAPEQIAGKHFLEIIPQEDRERLAAHFERTLGTGEKTPLEFRLMDNTGGEQQYEDGRGHAARGRFRLSTEELRVTRAD